MVVDAILGFGTTLSVDRGAGYVDIVKIFEIGEFGPEADDVEQTTHASPGGHREFRRGLVDPGDLSWSGYWIADDTQDDLLQDLMDGVDSASLLPYRVELPQGMGQFDCDGYVRNFKLNPQMDGNLECSGELKWSGQAAFTIDRSAGLTTPFFVVSNSEIVAPTKAQATLEYVVTVDTLISSVTVTPTAAVGVIRVNGNVVATGVASSAIALGAAGSVTVVTITVTETGKAPKEYTLRIVRDTV